MKRLFLSISSCILCTLLFAATSFPSRTDFRDESVYFVITTRFFDGDTTNTRHILYNCTATRPNIAGKTNEEEVEPNTESLTLSAVALPNGYVKARTGTETIENEVEGWYNAVWMPAK